MGRKKKKKRASKGCNGKMWNNEKKKSKKGRGMVRRRVTQIFFFLKVTLNNSPTLTINKHSTTLFWCKHSTTLWKNQRDVFLKVLSSPGHVGTLGPKPNLLQQFLFTKVLILFIDEHQFYFLIDKKYWITYSIRNTFSF
jgi:hypothetical protein